MFVVAGCPCTMRPSFLPCGSMIQIPPAPPQYTLPATSTFMPSGTPGSAPRRSANTRSLAFIRRERKPVGNDKIVDQQAERTEIGRETVHARKGQVPLFGSGGVGPWV